MVRGFLLLLGLLLFGVGVFVSKEAGSSAISAFVGGAFLSAVGVVFIGLAVR